MMTTFLCLLAAASLLGFADYGIKGTVPARVAMVSQALSIVCTLGLATLALVSYLS